MDAPKTMVSSTQLLMELNVLRAEAFHVAEHAAERRSVEALATLRLIETLIDDCERRVERLWNTR